MLESQFDQHERRAVLRNDASVREQAERRRVFAQDQSLRPQATTMHQFAQADALTPRGRFSAVEAQTVVGANPVPNYPAAAAHQADPCGIEPPLGYRIDAMPEHDPVEVSSFPQQQTDPADAPSTPLGQRAGSLSQSTAQQPQVFPALGKRGHAAEPSRSFRRF